MGQNKLLPHVTWPHTILLLQAIIEIISNPVNSTVPIASEVLKAAGRQQALTGN